jgi:hypothetical protein
VTARATKRAMATVTVMMVVGVKEGNGDSGKSNNDGNKGGWQATAMRAIGQGWRANDGDKGGINGNGNNVGNGDGDGDEAGGQHRGKGQGRQGSMQWQ